MLKAQLLLGKLAVNYQKKKLAVPRESIEKRLKNIKYLTSQKKIPKRSLRKEVMHLEEQMQSIYEIEKALLKQKKEESTSVASLKRQITILKKNSGATRTKDLQCKVERLTHLLAETMSNDRVASEIKEINRTVPRPSRVIAAPTMRVSQNSRVTDLQQRLMLMKNELAILKHQEKDPQLIEDLEKRINLFESKLLTVGVEPLRPRHTIVPPPPQKIEIKN